MEARSLRFVGPRTVDVETRDRPTPDADEVVVRTRRSLVSGGTELMIYRGEAPADLPADETIDALDGDLSFPLAFGYAAVGEVEGAGADVPASWTGERVFAFHPHASLFTAAPEALVPVPDDVDVETATFLPIAETAVNLVADGAPRIGERVVVFGAGLVGLFTVSALAAFPLAELTVVEPLPARRALAERLGADRSMAPDAVADADFGGDGVEGIGTGGGGEGGDGADLVFEVSGSPAALDAAVGVAGYDARVVVGSWYGEKRADLDLGGQFHRSRVSIVSSQVSTIDPDLRGRWDHERRMDVAWERLQAVPVADLITHRVPIEGAERAYELLDSAPDEALGVLLTYE